ncbi:uncharacterized protein [Parasteatoda tepidariorum]|uniref:uncharacterized protein n=1 Tax=Parasteatoda tepidariorum TaxID=114398 RepID=UPI0039BD63F1
MPRLRGRARNIGRRTRNAQLVHDHRLNRTVEEHLTDNVNLRNQVASSRENENSEQRNQRLRANALRQRETRQRATNENRERDQRRMQDNRALIRASLNRLAFEYDPEIDYSSHALILIGSMDNECQYCHALKYKGESPGLCCASGKISLPPLNPPPEPLKTLLAGTASQSKLFLRKIRKFNSCFQMTSFGATKIVHNEDGRNFESTFKIQGQVYHQIGSLLPMPNVDPKFLQIYFMGDEEQQTHTRCVYNHIEQMEEREIVDNLETFLQNHNQLIRLFKTLSSRLQNDNYAIVIKADKVPYGEHAGTYNVPTVNEVAVVMAGNPCERRDIRIQRRDNTIQIIQDNHRSYDALQYPLIFWEGEDGYHLNIKQRNPTTGEELIKKVSAMNFYAYRLMIRENEDNNILRCRQLFNKYIVDMYVKIESERLRYIKFNQAKLRSEVYIHLRDAIIRNVDATNDVNNIGTAYILPSSIGSPRHMQEYIQDAMTYVRAYGRPDLFITLTCNPNWDEIKFAVIRSNIDASP